MTPQELKLLDELFDRLASLESAPRDADAVRAINEGLQRAPNALYPLVQTALVQDEALKQADARIRELEAELGIGQPQPPQQGGFLDSMRDALMGKREQEQRGSVPSVRAGAAPDAPQSPWRNTAGMQGGGYRQEPGYAAAPLPQAPGTAPGMGGGSFLGTAAATAAGVVGGALLANSFRGMFGGGGGQGQGQSHSAFDSAAGSGGGSPWGGNISGSDLAREAGVNDIGGSGRTAAYDDRGGSDRAGLFDVAQNDADFDDGDYDDGGDFGGDDGGDTA
ncbi:MAG: DUF2076 domain-containing protein [Xanthobacteraceae bacterium]|nr:DUF2076 domain-containing protein [Xanthobacteraceae bacterium]